jgi:hypothetical protein
MKKKERKTNKQKLKGRGGKLAFDNMKNNNNNNKN